LAFRSLKRHGRAGIIVAMVGQTIGKYRVVEQIGRGGMGTFYKAIDETLDRRVALKLLNADLIDQDAVERFRREAMMLAKLNHGRIGAIHELTRNGHDFLMVMEYLEGETFEKLIERGPMAVPRAISLVSQVLDALEYAHGAGVIHRDLKPANLMLTPAGDVKVMDFGIARVQGSEHLTTNGYMVGTPAYMAPEQVRGEEVDPRMDLYSIAVVLYRMLTHHLPFHGDTAIAMIHSQLNNPPTPPQQFRADLPEWLVGALERGLAKKPADRFQTAREFRTALEKGLTGKMPVVKPTAAALTTPSRPMPSPPATRNIPGLNTLESAPAPWASQQTASGAGLVAPSSVAPQGGETAPRAAVPSSAAGHATVTLRPRHLATAAVLVTVLVIGGGILAFIALRRPTTIIVPAPSTVEQPTAPASDAPPATTSTVTTTEPAPVTASTAATPPNTSTAPSSASPSAPATSAASRPPKSASSPSPATNAVRGGGAPSTNSSRASTAAGGGATAETPATPEITAAAAPAQNFGDVRALVFEGSKSREVDALLSLEPGNLIVRSKSDGAVLRTVPYTAIAAATYARARRPRGQTVVGASNVPDDVGGSGLFGGARHWLTLQTSNDYVIIRLEDRNVIGVLNGLEARTGGKILRTQGN
jgi:eukaryotic-like serine/threonine-protein kinase